MNVIGIIPARYGSSRFPGKPLADILGKPMVWHVYTRAKRALNHVVVATDDKRIFEVCRNLNLKVVMTSWEHSSGTERCSEALDIYQENTGLHFDFVINIQGDEPLIDPQIITILEQSFDEQTQITTLIRKERDWQNLFDPNIVKVIIDNTSHAIYFSRTAIPFIRDAKPEFWTQKHQYFSHIGIYAYRSSVLKEIVRLPKGQLEKAEKLEQLRWIEYGYKIKVELVDYLGIGVDTQKDIDKIIEILKAQGNEQF